MSDAGTSGKPGRYQRSVGGLIGAMVVLVVVVLAIVGYRELFRTDAAVDPAPVDYLDVARGVASTGLPAVAPEPLPEGWVATSADLDRDPRPNRPIWRMGMLTGDERFVGLRQGERSAEELIASAYPDDPVEQAASARLNSAVAQTWQTWEIGDELGYTAEVGQTVVLVHGSAGREALEETVGRLARAAGSQAPSPSSSPSSSVSSASGS